MTLLTNLIDQESAPIDQSDRYRLLPTIGRHRSWFVYGKEIARKEAECSFAETGIPVLVCKFPPDGLVQRGHIVGKKRRTS